jgi:hypothetical protein
VPPPAAAAPTAPVVATPATAVNPCDAAATVKKDASTKAEAKAAALARQRFSGRVVEVEEDMIQGRPVYKVKIIRPDGEVRWVNLEGKEVLGSEGTVGKLP